MHIKLKANIPEVVLGVLLTLAVFAMGMAFESQRHLTNQPAGSNPQQIQTGHKPDPFSWDWLTHDGVVFFTCVLAFVAGIQAYLFVRQLRVMSAGIEDTRTAAIAATRQAKATEESFAKLERPYLFVFNISQIEIHDFTDADGFHSFLLVRYSVANFGKMPAIIEAPAASLSVSAHPLSPPLFDFNHQLSRSPVIAPGEIRENVEETFGWDDRNILIGEDGDRFPDIGAENLWFYATVGYRGPFTTGHETSVCLRCDPRTGSFFQPMTVEGQNYYK